MRTVVILHDDEKDGFDVVRGVIWNYFICLACTVFEGASQQQAEPDRHNGAAPCSCMSPCCFDVRSQVPMVRSHLSSTQLCSSLASTKVQAAEHVQWGEICRRTSPAKYFASLRGGSRKHYRLFLNDGHSITVLQDKKEVNFLGFATGRKIREATGC